MASKTAYRELIEHTAGRYRLDADLLEAQVLVESSGQADAFRFEEGFYQRYILGKSLPYGDLGPLAACSYGLLQCMYAVAYEIGFRGRPEELFIARVGLDLGAKKMRALVDWAGGDVEQALCAYNGGPGLNHVRPFANQRYADKIFRERDRRDG